MWHVVIYVQHYYMKQKQLCSTGFPFLGFALSLDQAKALGLVSDPKLHVQPPGGSEEATGHCHSSINGRSEWKEHYATSQ